MVVVIRLMEGRDRRRLTRKKIFFYRWVTRIRLIVLHRMGKMRRVSQTKVPIMER